MGTTWKTYLVYLDDITALEGASVQLKAQTWEMKCLQKEQLVPTNKHEI